MKLDNFCSSLRVIQRREKKSKKKKHLNIDFLPSDNASKKTLRLVELFFLLPAIKKTT